MDYAGQVVDLPVGMDGLRTDDPHNKLSAGNLVRALNINLQGGKIEKDFGSRRWNDSALPAAVKAGIDFWPNEVTQRVVVMCSNGKVYKMPDVLTQTEITGSETLNTASYANIVQAGEEETGNNRKLFLFTGVNPVQVISGDATTRSTIASGAADWTGTTHPIDGIMFRGRLFCWLASGPTVYVSSATNHEDFTTTPILLQTDSDAEGTRTAFIHNQKLYFLRYPQGLYVLDDSNATASNWFLAKVNGVIGTPNTRSAFGVFDDVAIANQFGGISALTSVAQLGDIKTSDIFAQLRCQQFVRDEILQDGRGIRQGIYYEERKIAMFIYRSRSGTANDRICYLDFQNPTQPKVVWNSKDQPNCLFLVKDIEGVRRPFYGADDGYLYKMDQVDRWVGVQSGSPQTAYAGTFWTPFLDFGGPNANVAENVKIFDFLEVLFEPTGDFDLDVDVFIDGRFHRQLKFNLGSTNNLDAGKTGTVITDTSCPLKKKLPIQGSGSRIQFRCSNSGVGENFKIIALRVYFQPGGRQEKKN